MSERAVSLEVSQFRAPQTPLAVVTITGPAVSMIETLDVLLADPSTVKIEVTFPESPAPLTPPCPWGIPSA